MSTNIEWTDLTDDIIRAKEGGEISGFPVQMQVREFPISLVIKSKTLDFLAQTEG